MVSRNGNLKLLQATPGFEQQPKATKSSGKENIGLGQQANRFSPVCCVRPPAPLPPLPDCYVGHPLPCLLIPLSPADGKVGWWKGARDAGSGVRRLRSRNPASVSPAPAVWLPMSEAAVCAGVRPPASRVFAWLPQAPRLAASRSPLCPSAVESSPHTPAGSDRSSLWFSLPLGRLL